MHWWSDDHLQEMHLVNPRLRWQKKAAKSLHKRQIKHEKSNIINKNSEGKWSPKIDSKHFDLSCQILVLQMITCNAHAVLVIMPCATRTFPASDSRVGQVAIFLKMKYKLITGLGSFFFFQLQKLRVGCQSSTCPTVLDAGYNQLFKDCFADCLEGLPIGTFRPSAWFILRNLTLDYLMQCWYISIYNYIYIRYIDMSISISL